MNWIRTSMTQRMEKDNPLAKLAREWKSGIRMGAVEWKDVPNLGTPDVATLKVDGELTAWSLDGKNAIFVSKEGRVREGLPAEAEMSDILRGHGPVDGVGELYVVDEKGNPIPYPDAVSILRKPKDEADLNRIHLSPIDLLHLDGRDMMAQEDYSKRHAWLEKTFGKAKLVHPVHAVDPHELTDAWDKYVLHGPWEGLVLHFGNKIIKVKPLHDQDLAVIGIERSAKHPELMGALVLAYMDEEGRFRYAGKVGTGFKEPDRKEWMKYAQSRKIREEGRVIWVHPDRVVQVQSREFRIQETPAYDKDLKPIGKLRSAVGRMPVLLGIRHDKTINPSDLRLEQIPEWDEETAKEEAKARASSALWVEAGYPKHPDTVIIKPNEWYHSGLNEKQIWEYYDANKKQLVRELAGRNVVLVIATPTGNLIRRNDPKTGKPIRIESIQDFERWNNGRVVEWHSAI